MKLLWNVRRVRGISFPLMCGNTYIFLAFLQIQKLKYSQLLHKIVPKKTTVFYHFFTQVTDEFFRMIEMAIALLKY